VGSGHRHVPTIRMVTLRLQLRRGQPGAGTGMLPVPAPGQHKGVSQKETPAPGAPG
jgi:hypothetical protein